MAKDSVATTSLAYDQMKADYWDQIDALRGTTVALRSLGKTYLPKHAKEEDTQWRYRRDRSFLYPAYDDAITRMAGKPFAKPVTVSENMPEALLEIVDNADLTGRNLTMFARDVLDEGCSVGLTHVLVDYANTGGGQSMGEEQTLGLRPVFIHYKSRDVWGWESRRLPSGVKVPAEVRLHEESTERVGNYNEVTVQRVRVYRERDFEVHRLMDDGEWMLEIPPTPHTYPDGVPFRTFYTNQTGFMTAKPPLWGLADLNLQHWQIASDYANVIHVVSSPVLMVTGASEDQVRSFTAGAGRMVVLPEGADMKWVEHTGMAVDAGRDELDKIEGRMRVLAMSPYLERGSATNQTAMANAIHEGKSQSWVQMTVKLLEAFLLDLFWVASRWRGIELPEDASVEVYSDFTLGTAGSTDLDTIRQFRQAGDIDRETALFELKRRGVLSESAEIEEILERIEQEGPDLSSLIPPVVEDEDEEEEEEEGEE